MPRALAERWVEASAAGEGGGGRDAPRRAVDPGVGVAGGGADAAVGAARAGHARRGAGCRGRRGGRGQGGRWPKL
jgi:hypothetical protein